MATLAVVVAAKKQGDFYETLFRKILEGKGTRQDKQPILKTLQKSRENVQRIRELLGLHFTDENKEELQLKVNIELARLKKLENQLKTQLSDFNVDEYNQWLQNISVILEKMKRGLITDFLDAENQKELAILFGRTSSRTGGAGGKNNLRF